MPNVLLIDIDSKIPNLALHKISVYHQQQGDSVSWGSARDLIQEAYTDKVYVSCVFVENKAKAEEWEGLATIGGSGYRLDTELPWVIEETRPHINLGFTTRGCIRHCNFCIVPLKEGGIRIVGDLLDLWDGCIDQDKMTVLDNNILAVPKHFKLICQQARDNHLLIDFTQGLDHRLLTADIVAEMTTIRHREYRFSYDRVLYEETVVRALKLLKKNGITRSFWYVLVGYDTTYEEDMYRLELLRKWNQTVFVTRYIKTRGNLLLSRWANQHAVFKAMTFSEFLAIDRNAAYYAKYRAEIDEYLDPGGAQ